MPIDLDAPESFLFVYFDNGHRYAVSVPGRTEAEARHRFSTMSKAERRSRIVARLSRPDTDLVADLWAWATRLLGRLTLGRAV